MQTRSADSDTNAYTNANSDSYVNTYSDADANSDTDSDIYANTYSEPQSDSGSIAGRPG